MKVQVVDYQSPAAAKEFTDALKEIGFVVLSNPPIDPKLISDVYALWDEFFKSEEKFQYAFDPKTHDGFISQALSETAKGYSIKDIKEFYHLYWNGRCPEKQRAKTKELFHELTVLAETLLKWIEEYTPTEIRKKFSMPLTQMVKDCPKTLFRIIHYPPLTGKEPPGAVRAAAHEDINIITLLPAATAEGLEVKDKQGNWLAVPCNPNWIIVNAADMLQECTDHYYPSTTHRVANPTGENAKKPRLSMPLFLHANSDVRLSEKRTADSYRHERYVELGLDDKKS